MATVTIQEGYKMPFDAYRRKRKTRRTSAGARKQQNKMKSCAAKWKRSGKRGSYRAFMKKCL